MNQPREGILFELPVATYRVATGTRNLVIDGFTYTAEPSQRDEVTLATSENGADLVVRLPVKHAVVKRWLAGAPPKRVRVSVYRKQMTSGESERIWQGDVTSIALEGRVAALRVPSLLTESLQRRLPTVTVGRSCPHILYDANCRVDRADFDQSATVTAVDGRKITVSTVGGNPDDWFTFGEVLHVSSGERMTIHSQVGTEVTMQLAIYELKVGDTVTLFAGCDHLVGTCHTKFDNRVNHGGFVQLVTTNPLKPTWFGYYEEE